MCDRIGPSASTVLSPRPTLPGLLLALALLLPLAAGAAAPHHRWQTLESPHFEVHFHEGLYPAALRAARSLERAHERLVPLLGAEPGRKTQVVVSDDTDAANGSATAAGRPVIHLLAEPPDDLSVLGDYDDYVYLLVAHEYVHVLHLGTVGGVPAVLNTIFGDVWIPNGVQPRFVTEGLATYQESVLSSAGRMRSSLFEMYLRADVLEDRVLDLGQLSGGPGRWPWGTAWYLYGGKLLAYLAATRGDEAILRYSHTYGTSVVPWAMNVDLRQAADTDFLELYDEWVADLRARYAAQRAAIEASGPLTVPAIRTFHGERTMAPRWGADGALYYVEASADRLPWLRRIERAGGADVEVRELGGSGEIAPLPDGGILLARFEQTGAYQSFGDLFRVGPEEEVRLTRGLRASEPDVARDGSAVVFVQRGQGRTRIALLPLRALAGAAPPGREVAVADAAWIDHLPARDGVPRVEPTILHDPGGLQVYTPRFSPDGRRVVFSRTRAGSGRDLFLLDRESGTLQQLTDDEALDLDPVFTPDGGAVIFSSDRTGVFNLYRLELASGATVRLTNVLTGAFQPDVSPDGSWIAWTAYSSRGFDVAAAPLASLRPLPAAAHAARRPAPVAPQDGAVHPVRPYDPLETLAPQTWFPYLGSDRAGTVLGASVAGSDVVGRHAWSLSGGVGLGSRQAQAAAGYSYAGFHPRLSLGASTVYRAVPGFPTGTTERASGGGLSLTFPWGSNRRAHSFTVGWEGLYLDPLEVAPWDAPEAGLASELQFTFGFGSTERPAEAISAEDGVSLQVGTRFGSEAFGGDFAYAALDVSGGAFLRLPWGRHHVLALLGRAGIGQGDLGRRRLFSLGGPTLRDPLLDLLYTGNLFGTGVLRGYEPGAFAGSNLVLGSAEYRFPIWRADAGLWTLPFYAGQLSGAFFAEAGDAFDGLRTRRLHPAAGAELRWALAVGHLGGTVRLGYGYGFDVADGGGHRAYLGVGAGF